MRENVTIDDYLDSIEFFYSRRDSPQRIYEQALQITQHIKQVDQRGFVATAILGFPSYCGIGALEELPVEFSRYIGVIRNQIGPNYKNPCPPCEIYGNRALMSTTCTDCQASKFNPQMMRRVKQDVDFLLIHNGDPQCIERIKDKLIGQGFVASWFDMPNALSRVSASCRNRNLPLPLDIRLTDYASFFQWSRSYRPGNLASYRMNLESLPLHDTSQLFWNRIPFLYGPITVGTIMWIDVHPKLQQLIEDSILKTIAWLREKYPLSDNLEESLVGYAREISTYLNRFTAQPYLYQRMINRIGENFAFLKKPKNF